MKRQKRLFTLHVVNDFQFLLQHFYLRRSESFVQFFHFFECQFTRKSTKIRETCNCNCRVIPCLLQLSFVNDSKRTFRNLLFMIDSQLLWSDGNELSQKNSCKFL